MIAPAPSEAAEAGAREAAFFARHVVVHTHVAKCAGSTLWAALRDMFGAPFCLDLRPADAPRPSALPPEQRARLRLLSGHFRAGTQERHFTRQPVLVATVRDPLARLCSFLGFLARSPDHPEYPRFGLLPPGEAVAEMIATGHRMAASSQCRVLSGTPCFAAARRAVEEDYLLVLPHHRVLDIARLFAEVLGLQPRRPGCGAT